MVQLCPFRKAAPPVVGALYVTAYGAVGDGETDDTTAIQECIDAAYTQSKNVFFPAGTYLVTPGATYALLLKSNVKLFGLSTANTIIKIPNQETTIRFILYGSGVDYGTLENLTLATPDPGNMTTVYPWYTSGLFLADSDHFTITNVVMDYMRQGVKVGSGATTTNLTVTGLVTHYCITAVYLADVNGATFTGCDLSVVDNDSFNNHCVYMEKEVHNVDFYGSSFDGAGGYVIHCYLEGDYTSDYIEFNDCDFVSSEQTVLIGSKWSYVSFVNGCNFICSRSAGPFLFYGGDHVTVEDFTASSPYYLLSREATVTNVLFKDGVFDGTALMPQSQDGITFTNVSIV